ncbi:NH(3)-dependent NAD(+) synthetase [Striga asiatica]|uniref:NH(3)-dependent NAD(+) synthetase n=1 Tax=Striga asiatica TaxID=4170 RepID=A0A5A7QTF2_STRAF|nr:NH(3)-dependent NAD(+) synthetase [Striga asiatica]
MVGSGLQCERAIFAPRSSTIYFRLFERIRTVGENSFALWRFAYRVAQSYRFQQCPSRPSAGYYGLTNAPLEVNYIEPDLWIAPPASGACTGIPDIEGEGVEPPIVLFKIRNRPMKSNSFSRRVEYSTGKRQLLRPKKGKRIEFEKKTSNEE